MNSTKREKNAAECFRTASDALGTIRPGFSLFGLTRGQFSMIDLILACLDQTGPARVSLWTWCIARYEVECFERLLMDRRITSALLVIDSQARTHNREILKKWQAVHGPDSIKWVVNHAKVATIETADWKLLLRGSMNLNFNPRFEQFDVDEGHPGFELIRRTEAELPLLHFDHPNGEARRASKIDAAWGLDALQPFQKLKTWAK
jgi:hypothetical protein